MPPKSSLQQTYPNLTPDPNWLKSAPHSGDTYLELRISRKLLIALIGSLLIHALLLYVFERHHIDLDMLPAMQSNNTLTVELSPSPPAQKPAPAAPPPRIKPKTHPAPVPPRPITRPVLTAPVAPTNLPTSPPAPLPVPNNTPEAPTDMTSYINAVRARRNAANPSAAAQSGTPQPSADEIRMATIKRNLQPQGGGGVFQIKRIGVRSATFLFRGWENTYTSPLQETITVETDGSTDIEHAIIRRMISIIRARHNGDFTWESQRLNRVVPLSARPQDNAGLEDFLMQEFFGTALKPSQQ